MSTSAIAKIEVSAEILALPLERTVMSGDHSGHLSIPPTITGRSPIPAHLATYLVPRGFLRACGGSTVILPPPPTPNLQLKHLCSQTFLDGYKKFSQVAGLHRRVLVGGLVSSRGGFPQSPAHNAIGVPATTKLFLARRAIRPLATNTFCILF